MSDVPGLAWLESFTASISTATGSAISHTVQDTVNPLIKTVTLKLSEPVSGKILLNIWNLFQKYAAANETYPTKYRKEPDKIIVEVAIKQRLGQPKDSRPWNKDDEMAKRNRC